MTRPNVSIQVSQDPPWRVQQFGFINRIFFIQFECWAEPTDSNSPKASWNIFCATFNRIQISIDLLTLHKYVLGTLCTHINFVYKSLHWEGIFSPPPHHQRTKGQRTAEEIGLGEAKGWQAGWRCQEMANNFWKFGKVPKTSWGPPDHLIINCNTFLLSHLQGT